MDARSGETGCGSLAVRALAARSLGGTYWQENRWAGWTTEVMAAHPAYENPRLTRLVRRHSSLDSSARAARRVTPPRSTPRPIAPFQSPAPIRIRSRSIYPKTRGRMRRDQCVAASATLNGSSAGKGEISQWRVSFTALDARGCPGAGSARSPARHAIQRFSRFEVEVVGQCRLPRIMPSIGRRSTAR